MKRFLSLFLLVLALSLLLIGCGKVSGVEETIGPSAIYSENEIQSAMDIVKRQFSTGFEGCTLLELWYDEEVSLKEADEWAEQYGAKEAIVLLSNFYVTKNPTFSSHSTMKNWIWVLVRNHGGWELKTSGY